ncbi:hypothetical protein C8T65DRAFT_611394 [Cerioporus squamosus]|nr:hypothetical protein C8T65DRAFT_611394 [Cerioporus squamosus]
MSSDTTLTTDKVVASVVEHEKMLHNQEKHAALLARTSFKPSSKSESKGDKKHSKDKPKCAHCKKLGHKKDECRKLKAELEAKQKNDAGTRTSPAT